MTGCFRTRLEKHSFDARKWLAVAHIVNRLLQPPPVENRFDLAAFGPPVCAPSPVGVFQRARGTVFEAGPDLFARVVRCTEYHVDVIRLGVDGREFPVSECAGFADSLLGCPALGVRELTRGFG